MQKLQFKATITLLLLLLLSYFFLSKGELFIQQSTLIALAFSTAKPLNFLSFILIHVGLIHLLVNIVSLAFFSGIIESKLQGKDVIAMFFSSAIISGIAFVLLNPETALIGASSGISGLIATAFLLKPKKSVIAAIIVVLLSTAGTFVATGGLEKILKEKEKQIIETKIEIEKAIEEKQLEKAEQLEQTAEGKQLEVERIKTSIAIEKLTPTDALVHAVGALAGIGYLRLFRKKDFLEAVKNFAPLFKKMGL